MTLAPQDRLDPTPWRERAACRGRDVSVFFPPEQLPRQAREHLEQQAAEVCRSCPVSRTCLAFSIITGQRHGIWGGVPAGNAPAHATSTGRAWTCANCTTVNRQHRRRCTDCGTTRD